MILLVVRFAVQCCLWRWEQSLTLLQQGALHQACAVLPHQMKLKSLNSSLLTPCPGCLGTDVPPGNGVGSQHTSCAEQGFGAVLCLDSIAALLRLSAGQSGTQDYETSSHEPLPRTPTCTTCKCQLPLSPFASSPCGNVIPKVDLQSASKEGEGEC